MTVSALLAHLAARIATAEADEARQLRRAVWQYLGLVVALAVVGLLVAGCATPAPHSAGPYSRIDDATEVRIEDRPGGFRIFVNRSHYQFFPDQAELRHACRTAITSLAHDHAAQQARRLRPISQDRIRVDTGRNPWTAVTFCSASATVEYE